MRKTFFSTRGECVREVLVRMRVDAGLTQRQLAVALKATQAMIARVETGERRMDLPELCDWITATGGDPVATITSLVKVLEKKR